MNEVTEQELVSELVGGAERDEILTKFMSPLTAIHFENYLYFFADKLCESYSGGMWDIHSISRNGKVESVYFDLGRDINELVEVESMGWQRNVTCTWKAMGAAMSLMAYSQLSMRLHETDPEQAQQVSEAFHTLREFVMHTKEFTEEEQQQILKIID